MFITIDGCIFHLQHGIRDGGSAIGGRGQTAGAMNDALDHLLTVCWQIPIDPARHTRRQRRLNDLKEYAAISYLSNYCLFYTLEIVLNPKPLVEKPVF